MSDPVTYTLADLAITTPQVGAAQTPITGLADVTAVTLEVQFNYGSGGTSTRAYVQVSIDGGSTWMDVACFAFKKSSASSVVNLSGDTAMTASARPGDGTLADNTYVNGVLGAQMRVKLTTEGTYINTTLSVTASVMGVPSFDGDVLATGTTTPRSLEDRFADDAFTPESFGPCGNGSAAEDTATVQAMWNALPPGARVKFAQGRTYKLNPINAPIAKTTVYAAGAKFILNSTGVMFNLNPVADPANASATVASYCWWYGGEFTSEQNDPVTEFTIFQFYNCRQVVLRDCAFGDLTATNTTLTSAVNIGGLGGHELQKNRFVNCVIAINCPDWSAGQTNANIPITTSTFLDNEFILAAGQKAFYVNGGFDRWRIIGGFCNGSLGESCFHFTNNKGVQQLSLQGVGFEQAKVTGRFFFFESVTSSFTMSGLSFRDCVFSGDPVGGTHVHIDLQRVTKILLSNCYTSALIVTGNTALKMDANCAQLEVDGACRMVDPALNTSACLNIDASVNREMLKFPSRYFSPLTISGYNGDSFSTISDTTLDMSTLITGNRYQKHGVPPRGYTIRCAARDSGSAASVSTRVTFAQTSADLAGDLKIEQVDLRTLVNDRRASKTFYQSADTDGSIHIGITASGAATLDIWLYVLAIHY